MPWPLTELLPRSGAILIPEYSIALGL